MTIIQKSKRVTMHAILDEKELMEVIAEHVYSKVKDIKEIQISFQDKTNETVISPIICHIKTDFLEENEKDLRDFEIE